MLSTLWPIWYSHAGPEAVIVQEILRQSVPWLVSAVQETGDDTKQSGIKVVLAVENFRRLVVRAKNIERDLVINKTLVQLLHDVASCFNSAFELVCTYRDFLYLVSLNFTVWG